MRAVLALGLVRALLAVALSLSPFYPARAGADELPGVPARELWEGRWDANWDPNWFPNPGPLSLDITGGHRARESGEETYLFAALRVPLDALASSPGGSRASRPDSSSSWPQAGLTQAALAQAPASPSPSSGPELSSSGKQPSGDPKEVASASSDEAHSADGAANGARTNEASERGGVSPTAAPSSRTAASVFDGPGFLAFTRELSARACEARGSGGERARINSIARRSRVSGLVPELRVRGVYGLDQTRSLESVGLYPGETTTRDGNDSLVEVRLTFRLGRLLLGDEEPQMERLRQQAEAREREVEDSALELFGLWLDARLAAEDEEEDPRVRRRALVKEAEALSALHLMTDGWFLGEPTVSAFLNAAAKSPSTAEPLKAE